MSPQTAKTCCCEDGAIASNQRCVTSDFPMFIIQTSELPAVMSTYSEEINPSLDPEESDPSSDRQESDTVASVLNVSVDPFN